MASVNGTTSRKPSGSSTHSPGRSPSASPIPGHHKLSNNVFAGGMGGALKTAGTGWQDPNSLGVSRQRQAAAAQAAALSSPQRFDASRSSSRNGYQGYGTSTSPYAGQNASLPPTSGSGAYEGNAENDLNVAVKALTVQDDYHSSMAGGHSSQKPYIQQPHYPSYPQPDYSAYYATPATESYPDYSSYQYRPVLDHSAYASPPPPTPRAPVYSAMPTPQLSTTAAHDVLRSPTGFFPDYATLSRQNSSQYFYPNQAQAVMFHIPTQSPHLPNQMANMSRSTSYNEKKRDQQVMPYNMQHQQHQVSQQHNMFFPMRPGPAPHGHAHSPSSGYSPMNSFTSALSMGMAPRASSYSAGQYGMRVPPTPTYRQPGTPKGRRAIPDTASSTADSGVGLRSALLEDFRANKTRKWELKEIFGSIVEFSGDQHGSRFIQQKLETASVDDKLKVFAEIVPDHALPLMTDVFGNYVIQKLFEYGTRAQRDTLVAAMTGHVLSLSLQMYGCRVVQKAVEHIPAEHQTMFVNELESQVLKCVKDANGNHVIQKLIERVAPERLTFVDMFTGNVHDLATHPYGCRVLQRCFEHLALSQTRPLLDELHRYTSSLMQDQFGNYVVQFVLENGAQEDRVSIINSLSGHMLTMARHKFASNVCEKALVTADLQSRRMLIAEIMAVRPDSQNTIVIMMKDQYANYVLQRALSVAEGAQLEELMAKIRPQLISLRRYSNNYAKHLSAIERLMIERMPRNVSKQLTDNNVPHSAFTDFRVTPVVEIDQQ